MSDDTPLSHDDPASRPTGRWKSRARRVRNAAADAARGLATGAESPVADMRVALGHFRPAYLVWGLLASGMALYLATGVYSVEPGEAAVVRRFGAVVAPRVQPGLHYRLPWPVDRVDVVNVSTVRREQVGIDSKEEDHSHPEPPSKLQALSGDTNVVDIEVIAQYQVRDPADYLLNIGNAPYLTVRDALRGAVTQLVTGLPVDALLTSGRQSLQQSIRDEAQRRLDAYGSGLAIVGIDLQKAFPPQDVADAFSGVNTAREEKARMINEARGYANSLIPEARGEAQRLAAEARAYRSGVLASATGAAQAFEYLLAEYRSNSVSFGEDVTRYRMFLDTIEKILPRVRVYALDTERGGRFNLKLFGQESSGPILSPTGLR